MSDGPAPDLPGGIGGPATRALVGAGYVRLEQLDGVPRGDLQKLHGIGPKALGRLADALAERGMAFG